MKNPTTEKTSRKKLIVLAVVIAGWSVIAVGCGDADGDGQTSYDDSWAEGQQDDANPFDDELLDDQPPGETPDCPVSADAGAPAGMILTWQQDPTTTMTIDWHTEADDEGRPELCVRGAMQEEWAVKYDAETLDYPFGDRNIHRVEITGLQPGTEYTFQVGEFGEEYRFRTMPDDIGEQPVVFAAGGDVQKDAAWLEKTNEVIMEYDPDFIAWGGDLAYADAREDKLSRWESFLDVNMNTLIDETGRVVPIVAALGNHEAQDAYYYRASDFEQTAQWREQAAPYFYSFFAFPGQPGYGVLDFGDYMTLYLLDTDHTNPVDGEQTDWLESALLDRSGRDIAHQFAVYHVPAYPSHRDFGVSISRKIRKNWVPLFEQYGLDLVFENHDHTYKRTHPISDGEVDADEGIVFLGDGAWGVTLRDGNNKDAWYIDQFASERHGIVVTVDEQGRHVLVVNEDGEVIDEMEQAIR